MVRSVGGGEECGEGWSVVRSVQSGEDRTLLLTHLQSAQLLVEEVQLLPNLPCYRLLRQVTHYLLLVLRAKGLLLCCKDTLPLLGLPPLPLLLQGVGGLQLTDQLKTPLLTIKHL